MVFFRWRVFFKIKYKAYKLVRAINWSGLVFKFPDDFFIVSRDFSQPLSTFLPRCDSRR